MTLPPTRVTLPHTVRHRQRGSVLFPAGLFLALVLSGLAFATLTDAGTSSSVVRRHDHDQRALELAETGLVRAELQIAGAPPTDPLRLDGELGGGTYRVDVVPVPGDPHRFRLTAWGHVGLSTRRVEVGVRRRERSRFSHALFSDEDLVLGAALRTDAYDSRHGLYLLQANQLDLGGLHSGPGGDIGSNANIVGPGLATTWIRGDATPGPGHAFSAHGGLPLLPPTVTGSTEPAKRLREFPPPPREEFEAAAAQNDNGNWVPLLATAGYNAGTKSMSVNGLGAVLMPGGTYFFSSLRVLGGAALKFTGPTKIYVTGDVDITGGTIANLLGRPEDLQIYVHPYAVTATPPARPRVALRGAAVLSAAIYAPAADLSITGVADFMGAAVGRSISLPLATLFHYDKALGRLGPPAPPVMERLYWTDHTPPRY